MKLPNLIKAIINKDINTTKIYKGSVNKLLTIEVETKQPAGVITLLYKNEQERDLDFIELDNKAFASLAYNPYSPTPGPPM